MDLCDSLIDLGSSTINPNEPSTPTASAPAPQIGCQRRTRAKGSPPSFRKPLNDQVTVRVGEDKVPFPLPKAFLVHYSPYFEGALTGSFEEASTGVIDLEHTTSEAFGLCAEWIMTQQIEETPITKDHKLLPLQEKLSIDRPTFTTLIRLWILADYLGIPHLQNKAIDMLILKKRRTGHHPTQVFNLVFEGTMAGSPLRKLFVDLCCWSRVLERNLQGHPEDFPAEMLLDLAIAQNNLIQHRDMPDPRKDPKNYYVATEGHEESNNNAEGENSGGVVE